MSDANKIAESCANDKTSMLIDVDFTGATLLGADLSNTDLSVVVGLTQLQLNSAFGNDQTMLPRDLHSSYWR
jgi:uncharacterized protein YjbI with pentapeptide repeats